MRPQPGRLPDTQNGAFSGSAIDRTRPLSFRLDGRLISGFTGDTVLSAVLASGVDTLGTYQGRPVGLTPSANPAVVLTRASKSAAIPMESAPAIDNAEFITLGAHRTNPLSRLFLEGRTLGLRLDQHTALQGPWRNIVGTPHSAGDLIVIGGGVAGMKAALAAAKKGLAITLIEANPELGGTSGLFGTQDGEDSPEAEVARLRAAVEASEAISVLTRTHAFALRPGCVRVHTVNVSQGSADGKVLDLSARYIVLAPGSREKLPIFAGNRLPGVMGALDGYQLAARYGVWPGQSALVATASNIGYRLAMLASDAGIGIKRILDNRDRASSRFIEFSRAYGIVQMLAAKIQSVGTTKAQGKISVHAEEAGAEALLTERLLICGGWQPDLTLWHAAGGTSQWQPHHQRLEASGELDCIILAGSAAGYLTRQGCIESGADAVNYLLKLKRKPFSDTLIDPLYESPDSPLPVARSGDYTAPAFLDGGHTFLKRPGPQKQSWTDMFRRELATQPSDLSEAPGAISINEIVAGIALKLVPEDEAGHVAQERSALIPLLPVSQNAQDRNDPAPFEVPSYLEGRFGIAAKLVKVTFDQPRQVSSGTLLHAGPDAVGPLDAIGVVLRDSDDGAIALIDNEMARDGLAVSLSDQGQSISARIQSIGRD